MTYVGIAVLGASASVVIARSLRRWTLPTVAVVVLASIAATLLATWAIMVVTGSPWPSAIQLMMFPVLLQLGFVIIGGQAGRLLDLQQIKRYFPRIVAGFVVGFMIGGFAAVPLLDVVGEPEHLVVVSAASCAMFTVLVAITARRRPAELTLVDQPADGHPKRSMRSLLATRLVVLVFAYQLLSAMGSQVLDFLVFDRAAARYTDASELTRFVALYTGVINAVDIAFLLLLAAWLLTRFGLRLGLVANPAVVTVLTIAMLVATLGPGASSLLLFTLVVTARIVDISLTDGVTRGSINAIFQLLPVEERMAVQASVEGIGVPMAIGATGIVLLLMTALDLGTSWIIAFALVLCSAWTVAAVVAYGEYRGALGARLRRRGLDPDAALPVTDDEQTAARRLLLTDDVRDVRLGLDLGVTANLSSADVAELANHDDRDIRLLALGLLARRGDDEAAATAVAEVRLLAASDDAGERRAAALVLADIHPGDRPELLDQLLHDPDVTVRIAALNAVGSSDGVAGRRRRRRSRRPDDDAGCHPSSTPTGDAGAGVGCPSPRRARSPAGTDAGTGRCRRRAGGRSGRHPHTARRPPEPHRLDRRPRLPRPPRRHGRRADPRPAPRRRCRARRTRARRRQLHVGCRRRRCSVHSRICSPPSATGCSPCSPCATARNGSPRPAKRWPAPTVADARSASRCCTCRSRGPRPCSSTRSSATTST